MPSFNPHASRQIREAASHLVRCQLQHEERSEMSNAARWGDFSVDLVSDEEYQEGLAPLYQTLIEALDDGGNPDTPITLPAEWLNGRGPNTGPFLPLLAEKKLLTGDLIEAGRRAGMDAVLLWRAVASHLQHATPNQSVDGLFNWMTRMVVQDCCPPLWFSKEGHSQLRWIIIEHADNRGALDLWRAITGHLEDWQKMLQPQAGPELPNGRFYPDTASHIGQKKMDEMLWRTWLDTLEDCGVDLLHVTEESDGTAYLKIAQTPNALEPLLERGMDARAHTRHMPLVHHVMTGGDLDAVSLIIQKGGDPLVRDRDGNTGLHAFFQHRFYPRDWGEWDDAPTPAPVPGEAFFAGLHRLGFDLLATNDHGELAFEGEVSLGQEVRDLLLVLFSRLSLGHLTGQDIKPRVSRRL